MECIVSREVMVEKQMTGQRVDRAICDWFWDHFLSHSHSQVLQVYALFISSWSLLLASIQVGEGKVN